MKKIGKIMGVLAAGLMIAGSASAELLTNGGFELDAAGTTPPTSWTIVGAADQVKDASGGLDGISPQEGIKMFQLQATGGDPRQSGISQTFTVATAGDYEMSGWFAPRDSVNNGSVVYTFTLTDLSDSSIVTATTSTDPTITKGEWNNITRTYEDLDTGSYKLEFVNIHTQLKLLQGSVDDFSFEAVPEPATLGLVAAFGGGILFIRRKFMI